MKTFLSYVARDLTEKYGQDLSRTVVVFPNKRASLFLNEELLRFSAKEYMWSPRYVTISELFRQQTSMAVADHIKLICDLYQIYKDVTETTESLDEFYSWGELLLSDFDDVDKNMADPRLVFENTSQLHEYDSVEFLTDQQKEILKQFFATFKDNHEHTLRIRFEKLWNRLGTIYTQYKAYLESNGIAYEGMLYRSVAEQKEPLSTMNAERFIFVGFNMIQKVEQQLFEKLGQQAEVHFYWDYDEYYMPKFFSQKKISTDGNMTEDVKVARFNEAGRYIYEYMKHFPNEITDRETFRNLSKPKDITYVSATTEDIQARYISQWLTKERIDAGRRTAIVLCNENILPTVINCLPESVEHVNITTGYPLTNTPVISLLQNIFAMANMAQLKLHLVNSMLRHPYIRFVSQGCQELMARLNEKKVFFPSLSDVAIDENLQKLFSPIGKSNIEIADRILWVIQTIARNSKPEESEPTENYRFTPSPLMQETLYRTYTTVARLRSLVENDGLEVDTLTFQRLIIQALRTTNVPFHGEPVIGIQIMGVLETRNLDFDHLLVLSCNEGNMPRGVNDSSFIPHAIRAAYGLTTVENKVGIYSYYFHRLLQRASDITITYNASTEDGQTGEKSRFMSQLMAESSQDIHIRNFNAPLATSTHMLHSVRKDEIVMEKLMNMKEISPSAVNTYLRCPLQFFYKVICGINDGNDDDDNADLDQRIFGLVFHNAMERLYAPFVGKTLTESIIESIRKDERKIQEAIEYALKKELFRMSDDDINKKPLPKLNGNEEIQVKVIKRLINNLLCYDKSHAPMQICGLEKRVYMPFEIPVGESVHPIRFKGFIDRLDIVNGADGKPQMRVVDYKTGNAKQPSLPTPDDVFITEMIDKHCDYFLQTMLYCIMVERSELGKGLHIAPALLYPSHTRAEGYDPILYFKKGRAAAVPIYNIADFEDDFTRGLKGLLAEIFAKDKDFCPTSVKKRCEKCFYNKICNS